MGKCVRRGDGPSGGVASLLGWAVEDGGDRKTKVASANNATPPTQAKNHLRAMIRLPRKQCVPRKTVWVGLILPTKKRRRRIAGSIHRSFPDESPLGTRLRRNE